MIYFWWVMCGSLALMVYVFVAYLFRMNIFYEIKFSGEDTTSLDCAAIFWPLFLAWCFIYYTFLWLPRFAAKKLTMLLLRRKIKDSMISKEVYR